MISERRFASSFDGFWSELLPLLTAPFVHMIGENYKERLTGQYGFPLQPIEKTSDTDSAIIAEFAFYLTKSSIEKELSVQAAYDDVSIRKNAELTAITAVQLYEGAIPYPVSELDDDESREGLLIAKNYPLFFKEMSYLGKPEFGPIVQGAGFLQTCQADLSIGSGLFEVKTVTRNIASKDIKQLIVYLALQAATGKRKWTTAGFFNPRKGEYHEFAVDEVLAQISGGRSSSEIYHTLIDFVGSWDVQLDSAF